MAKSTVLRCKDTPEAKAAFQPLWDQRNECMEEQGRITELMFAAANRNDMTAHAQHREALEALQLEEQRLSREMRDHQFNPEVGETA